MCITLHPSRMTSTKLYAGEARIGDTYVHVLAYKNKTTSLSPGVNAMILPIPTNTKLGPENVIDTRGFPGFVDSIAAATRTQLLSLSNSDVRRARGVDAVFDVGSYTVVVGTKMGEVVTAAAELPAPKRPDLNREVLSAMAGHYPGWAFALCCWSGSIDPEPLLWWYEPMNAHVLFAPALDGHDGKAPRQENVATDHIVTFGSTIHPKGEIDVRYKEPIPTDVAHLLPTRAIGTRVCEPLPNGDFYYEVSNFRARKAEILRVFPGLHQPITRLSERWA